MSELPPLTPGNADHYARSMGALERRYVMHCSPLWSKNYAGLARDLGVNFEVAERLGWTLIAKGLAEVKTTRFGNEYTGSAIFLNERGQLVRHAIIERFAWAKKLANRSGL